MLHSHRVSENCSPRIPQCASVHLGANVRRINFLWSRFLRSATPQYLQVCTGLPLLTRLFWPMQNNLLLSGIESMADGLRSPHSSAETAKEMAKKLPFKIGQVVEAKSFSQGYRGAWFECKVSDSRNGKHVTNFLMISFLSWCAIVKEVPAIAFFHQSLLTRLAPIWEYFEHQYALFFLPLF